MSKERELYDLLEIEPNSTSDEIKKAFRKAALKHHPDRGGNEETFKKLNSAYEILSDPQKREIYDKHGKDGLKNSGSVPDDILASMFGNMFNFGDVFRFNNVNVVQPKTPSTTHQQKVTLEQLCNRKVIKLKVTRDRVCSCSKNDKAKTCIDCKGQGMKVSFRQFGPMIQQIQQPCNTCNGLGKIYNYCGNCKEGLISDPKVFEIHLTPELNNGYRYVFKEEGNESKGMIAGDFIVIIVYENHPLFQVHNKDLIYNTTITLKEALCGHTLMIDHPSGEKIKFDILDITTPYTSRFIQKGLTEDGKLEIRYKINFPEKLDNHQKELLTDIL